MKKKKGGAKKVSTQAPVVIIALAVIATVGYFLVTGKSPIPVAATSTEVDTSSWQTYRNEELGFSLKAPADYTATVYPFGEGNTVVFSDSVSEFEVRIQNDVTVTLENYSFRDHEIAGETTLDGREAVVFQAPDGYCDGPGCSDPYVTIAAKRDSTMYGVSFYGDAEVSDAERAVLSSFEFVE